MLVEVKVPALSESVAEATLVSWRKKAGEQVARDENLIDIETDKVVLELTAPVAGVLGKIIKGDGTTVTSGEVIATIDTEATTATTGVAAPKTAEKEVEPNAPSAPAPSPAAVKTPVMMPAARATAEQSHLDAGEIGSIKGSGRGGRITKEDVAGHVDRKAAAPSVPTSSDPAPTPTPAPAGARPQATAPATATDSRTEQRVPMSRLRARIAERLVQSQATAAILTTFNEVNMQAILELRTRHKEKFEKEHGVKLGIMSFFVKAVVAALKRFPIVNASVNGNDIIYHGYYDIGIAVSSPRGLVVPILRNAESLSQAQIEKQIADFGKRAQDGKLTIEELTGGTFSITNGGVFGSMLSTPIINPPQSAILGIHATKERPVAESGQVVIRPMCYLALSYDHRIIDGREAVLSLVAMKEALEYPMSPLLES
jgi:2-oxoglutarate dehydrogenase E2 component (dihydrolipoamide succinyltransferase)